MCHQPFLTSDHPITPVTMLRNTEIAARRANKLGDQPDFERDTM
jgi:hypothetical protein